MLIPIAVCCVVLGVWPAPVLKTIETAVMANVFFQQTDSEDQAIFSYVDPAPLLDDDPFPPAGDESP